MKNIIIYKLGLILMIFIITSCSQEEVVPKAENSLNFSDLKIDLNKSSIGSAIKVFDYANKTELKTKIKTSFNQVISDSRALIQKNKEITDIIINVSIKNGNAIITGITELNINKDIIVSSSIYDYKKRSYVTSMYPDSGIIIMYASCPDGYTTVASCSNLSNPQECAGEAAAEYFSNNISGVGDCANVQISVGTFNTKVCGKTC